MSITPPYANKVKRPARRTKVTLRNGKKGCQNDVSALFLRRGTTHDDLIEIAPDLTVAVDEDAVVVDEGL